ncbi:MAG: hypothetical protein PF638_16385 [Candidatus Delongbacteria bacterium]|jgi:hypothetical protein|nr:hypothetical protein [Candidatus Delongbacteria bacterium]
MTIYTDEEELFTEWKKHRTGFVSDGVACEEEYLKSEIKILFVLKEVNDPNGGNWDLREFVRNGGRRQTWNNISRWVQGIRNVNNDMKWSDLANIDPRRKEILKSIAAINLKKTPGGHTTNKSEMEKIAKEDKEFLNTQFHLYNPDLIICCGSSVTGSFCNLINFKDSSKWKWTSRGVHYLEFDSGKILIDYSHPEARVSDNLLYYGLIDAVKEVVISKT